jgi:hypothetical protein
MCFHKANPYFSTAWKYEKCLIIFSATWTKVHQTCCAERVSLASSCARV